MKEMSQDIATTDNNINKRKFSLVIHQDSIPASPTSPRTPAALYNISHPKVTHQDNEELKGRRPVTGNLMMLKQSSSEVPSIKIRSMSCPVFITSNNMSPLTSPTSPTSRRRQISNDEQEKRLSLKDVYNNKYVENLKKDLLEYYNQNNANHLEEEVIEEEEDHEEEEEDEELIKENEINSKILSSCISCHSCLTPPLEESEFEIDDTRDQSISDMYYQDSHEEANNSISSMSSIYTTHSINTEGKKCNRHHHRRPSCAIKFEEPKVMEWERPSDQETSIFKQNYSLNSSQ